MNINHQVDAAELPPLNNDLQEIIGIISDPRRCERLKDIGIHVEIREPQVFIPERPGLC